MQSTTPLVKMSKKQKPIIVFTSFRDAAQVIRDGFFVSEVKGGFYRFNLNGNFEVHSISLAHPDFEKEEYRGIEDHFKGMVGCLTPTYKILNDYNKEKDWGKLKSEYRGILASNKEDIKDWASSLTPMNIYLVCCWEDTTICNCHRKVAYDACQGSKAMKEIAGFLYRDGKVNHNAIVSNGLIAIDDYGVPIHPLPPRPPLHVTPIHESWPNRWGPVEGGYDSEYAPHSLIQAERDSIRDLDADIDDILDILDAQEAAEDELITGPDLTYSEHLEEPVTLESLMRDLDDIFHEEDDER
jgi:hypothetical protein